MDLSKMKERLLSIPGISNLKLSNEYNSIYIEYSKGTVKANFSLVNENGKYFLSDDGYLNYRDEHLTKHHSSNEQVLHFDSNLDLIALSELIDEFALKFN